VAYSLFQGVGAHFHGVVSGLGEEAHGPVVQPPFLDGGRRGVEGIPDALVDGMQIGPFGSRPDRRA
jgi:hypothetical protein